MTQEEKLALIAEILDCEEEDITPETVLANLDEWDSVAILSFIAMMDEKFDKSMKGSEIRQFVTVEDALKVMEREGC